MSIQALQQFLTHHMVSTGALTAVAAELDARTSGVPLDPRLSRRVRELLDALGAGDVLDDVGPQEAATMRSVIRAMYLLDAKLLFAPTRASLWSHVEPELLQSVGEAARVHAVTVTRELVPACDGLAERLQADGAALLDVGVGVAGSAIAMARMWPSLRIVGIDPWEPSLQLARENVDQAGLADRFELRVQGIEHVEDQDAYDLVWFANNFIPEPQARAGLERALAALRPGGWIMVGANNDEAPAALAALFRLRETQWGGPVWSAADAEQALLGAGFAQVRTLPAAPTALVNFVVGRRA